MTAAVRKSFIGVALLLFLVQQSFPAAAAAEKHADSSRLLSIHKLWARFSSSSAAGDRAISPMEVDKSGSNKDEAQRVKVFDPSRKYLRGEDTWWSAVADSVPPAFQGPVIAFDPTHEASSGASDDEQHHSLSQQHQTWWRSAAAAAEDVPPALQGPVIAFDASHEAFEAAIPTRPNHSRNAGAFEQAAPSSARALEHARSLEHGEAIQARPLNDPSHRGFESATGHGVSESARNPSEVTRRPSESSSHMDAESSSHMDAEESSAVMDRDEP